MGWDALAVITHKKNPVDNLTLDQVKKIFTGELFNWKQVGGPDHKIQVIARKGRISGVGRMARELVFKNPKKDFTSSAKLVKSSGPLERTIEHRPWTIGFTGISSARKRNVKILNLEGKEISYANIAKGNYILYRPLYLVVSRNTSPEVKKFVSYILSNEGQDIIRKEGTVTKKDGKSLWKRYRRQMKEAGVSRDIF